jgi:hypothetical protein
MIELAMTLPPGVKRSRLFCALGVDILQLGELEFFNSGMNHALYDDVERRG